MHCQLTSPGHNYIKYFEDFALEGQQAAQCWELNNLMRGDGKDLSKAANIPKASKNSLVNNAADSASDENWWLLYLIFLISSNENLTYKNQGRIRPRVLRMMMTLILTLITLRRHILSGSCLMAAGPGPGSHWVSINIVIGKQQDTGATARHGAELQPIRGQVRYLGPIRGQGWSPPLISTRVHSLKLINIK